MSKCGVRDYLESSLAQKSSEIRNIRTGSIDVHPTEPALIVSYQVESDQQTSFHAHKQELQKVIRLKDFSSSSDVELSDLAREVASKSRLIPESRIPEVEHLLGLIRQRNSNHRTTNGSGLNSSLVNVLEDESENALVGPGSADISQLDEYMELLYDDLQSKIRGSAFILQLAKDPRNLETMICNETLLGAMARILREDWKKSMDVTCNLLYAFFCFSQYSQFHAVVSHFKVGAQCMHIVENELKRGDSAASSDSSGKRGVLARKQDQLIRISSLVLLNLAEDLSTEVKMVRRGIVALLVRLVDQHRTSKTLLVIITFLRKLSVFRENVVKMMEHDLMSRLAPLFPPSPEEDQSSDVSGAMLRLLHNLSFDEHHMTAMVRLGFLPHVGAFLAQDSSRNSTASVLAILYHCSMEDDCKAIIAYTDVLPKAMNLILSAESVPTDALGFLVNMALNRKAAETMTSGERLGQLMDKATETQDVYFLKCLKNLSTHEAVKPLFEEYKADILSAVPGASAEVAAECLAILANLPLESAHLEDGAMVPWIKGKLRDSSIPDFLLLEVIIFLGSAVLSSSTAKAMLDQDLPSDLIGFLAEKQEDDEIVLQVLFFFRQLIVYHEKLRDSVLSKTELCSYLLDLMHDKNCAIRKICDEMLTLISEISTEWSSNILTERFKWHNAQWLEVVTHGIAGSSASSADTWDNRDIFTDLYGMQVEDILANYDDERLFT